MRIYAEVDRWADCYSSVSNLENRLPFTTYLRVPNKRVDIFSIPRSLAL